MKASCENLVLKPEQKVALTELINIGVGRAAGVLNDMLSARVSLAVPNIEIIRSSQLGENLPQLVGQKLSTVSMNFSGSFSGFSSLIFPPDSAGQLVSRLVGEDAAEGSMDSVTTSTLTEVGNILINGIMGSMGNVLGERLNYTVPSYNLIEVENIMETGGVEKGSVMLLAETKFDIRDFSIQGHVILVFEIESFSGLLKLIDGIQKS